MRVRLLLLVASVAAAATACADPAEGRFGADLYQVVCAGCHGPQLQGGVGPSLGAGSNSDLTLSDEQIAGAIAVGPGAMPGFGSRLTQEQITGLVDYIRSEQRP